MQLASKCPKCEASNFETVVESPKNSNFKVQFIRCASCRTVVGAMDYFNIGKLIHVLAEKLGKDL